MYKILNYNKSSNKSIIRELKICRFLDIGLYVMFFCFIILYALNYKFFNYNKIIFIILIIFSVVFWLIAALFISKTLKKYYSCTAYVLNNDTKEFYKIGIFPNIFRYLPNYEEFITDNYQANFLYSNRLKSWKLEFLRYDMATISVKNTARSIGDGVKNFRKYNTGFRSSEYHSVYVFNSLIKLYNPNYVMKQINAKKFNQLVYKITKIYSYELDDKDNYYIMCDIIECNENIEFKNVRLTIDKLFEENDLIKNYIINNCENNLM